MGITALSLAYELCAGAARRMRKGFVKEIVSVKVKGAKTDVWMNTVQRHFGVFLLSVWRAARYVLALCAAWVCGSPG